MKTKIRSNQRNCRRPKSESTKILLIEKDPGAAWFFRESLAGAGGMECDFTYSEKLSDTIQFLEKEDYDVIVLDPSLPDSNGFDTFISVRMYAPKIPIILLCSSYDEELAVKALQNGAQDCLIKGQLNGASLNRSIRYAIERHRIMSDLELARQKEYRMAYYDALTELPNRLLFRDRLDQALSRASRYDEKVAVMFIDLDSFKPVNDTLGHQVGDDLLKAVARRLKACLRKSDTVARLGGDEFTCILPDVKNENNVAVVANKIIDALARPFHIMGHRVSISGSIGISTYPDDATGADTLIKYADIAMYRAKKLGKNKYRFYSDKKKEAVRGARFLNSNYHGVARNRSIIRPYRPERSPPAR